MEHYKIKIYKKAQSDLEKLIGDINQFYTETSLSYYDEITKAIGKLALMPERCPLVRDEILRTKGYRRLLIKNYSVFYVIKGKTIQIRRILYNKQQYNNIL